MNAAPSANDCARLLDTQPLLDTLAQVDIAATRANLTDSDLPGITVMLDASLTVAKAGHNDLLATIREDVHRRLRTKDLTVRQAAECAAFAAAFGDLFDFDTQFALSSPWALAAVILDGDDLADAVFDAMSDDE